MLCIDQTVEPPVTTQLAQPPRILPLPIIMLVLSQINYNTIHHFQLPSQCYRILSRLVIFTGRMAPLCLRANLRETVSNSIENLE